MRPPVVIAIAVLLLAILGAAALQFVFLAPEGDGPNESGLVADRAGFVSE